MNPCLRLQNFDCSAINETVCLGANKGSSALKEGKVSYTIVYTGKEFYELESDAA